MFRPGAGYGGVAAVSRATGIAVSTINRALKELADGSELVAGQIRRPGGGRKPLVESDAGLMEALLALIEPSTRGDPESPLRWTYKSVRRIAAELCAQGHPISRTVVCELLHELNFSLQANCKTREGDSHPDRDAQFCYINDLVKTALIEQQPVISVDTKKKELVGDFKNGGREWRPKGQPSNWANDPAGFASHLGGDLNQTIAAASTPPGSSSSFSGGGSSGSGSSGGGGGGGGGSGW